MEESSSNPFVLTSTQLQTTPLPLSRTHSAKSSQWTMSFVHLPRHGLYQVSTVALVHASGVLWWFLFSVTKSCCQSVLHTLVSQY